VYTTVSNWRQQGRDIEFNGGTYTWSKHLEFEKFLTAPARVGRPLELALTLVDPAIIQLGPGDAVHAPGVLPEERQRLVTNGWQLTDAEPLTTDPWVYRDYLRGSRGEFTVAKDQNVRLRSGWFSERSACYLAAGRPVVTQDTGFGRVLPVGEGLFAFNDLDDVAAAFEAIESDYQRHSRAARAIAEEYFRAETVLSQMLRELAL
jgi:glycosyltransferase involved in cell wall biosynthesis